MVEEVCICYTSPLLITAAQKKHRAQLTPPHPTLQPQFVPVEQIAAQLPNFLLGKKPTTNQESHAIDVGKGY